MQMGIHEAARPSAGDEDVEQGAGAEDGGEDKNVHAEPEVRLVPQDGSKGK